MEEFLTRKGGRKEEKRREKRGEEREEKGGGRKGEKQVIVYIVSVEYLQGLYALLSSSTCMGNKFGRAVLPVVQACGFLVKQSDASIASQY